MPKAPIGLRLEDEETTRGLAQGLVVGRTVPVSAVFTPDPYRGWGRHHLARIRTQRAPVVRRQAPALNTVDRKASPGGWQIRQASGDTSQSTQTRSTEFSFDSKSAVPLLIRGRDSRINGLPTLQAGNARQGARTIGRCCVLDVPLGIRDGLPRHWRKPTWRHEFMVYQEVRRGPRLPDVGRLPLDSTGKVPLHSG
jgi:hypothetical protein